MSNEYYVYMYLREDETPYYVGKGKGGRAYAPHRYKNKHNFKKEILESRRFAGVHVPKEKDRIVFVRNNITEKEAYEVERLLISLLGRKGIDDNGILHNIQPGGERIKNENKWDVYNEEYRSKLKTIFVNNLTPGEEFINSVWYNNGETEVRVFENETVPEGYSIGRLNTVKEKMSSNSKIKDGKWYNNGKTNKIFLDNEEIPEGWVLGGLKHKTNKKKDWFQITNGKTNKWFKTPDKPIPDGWRKGLTFKPKERGVCIHCGFECDVSNLKRYHNDNCKKKE